MINPDRYKNFLRGQVVHADGRACYALAGEIDSAVEQPLARRLRELAGAHGNILDLDLADVSFCDSSGSGCWCSTTSSWRAAGAFTC